LALEDRIGQDVEISSLTCDTRTLLPGGLFAALKGSKEDGSRYLDEALAKGAAAVVCRNPPDRPGPWLVSRDPRGDYARLCANWFDRPGDDMTLLAVTGTNGKTTSTYLLKWVLEQCLGAKVGLIGTNQNLIGAEALPAGRTTPDPYVLQCLLAQMKRAGCSHVVMEVSSHALALERTAGLTFRVGIFTNLTRDHLDFHGTMAAYRQAKGKLFQQCRTGCFNLDDGAGRTFARTAPCQRVTFGSARREGDLRAGPAALRPDGVSFSVETEEESVAVSVPIPGDFTVSNALGVLACGRELGLPLADMAAALATAPGVKGRAEVVPVPAPYTVLIDYAHTPDALEKILTAARQVTTCRLICLFGCGGDRDRTKRAIMGEIASSLADFVILTSDNPRTENPETILDQVAAGFPRGFQQVLRQPDRRAAIRAALSMGRAGDVILLAGKGHETYQEIGTERIHLDEREEITSFFLENRV
jgi:UDP-N-acetylmuramoyl-L-alanyl-D-glutamate--2,6-diaminopimelate ligase